jgi:hypothetical protein
MKPLFTGLKGVNKKIGTGQKDYSVTVKVSGTNKINLLNTYNLGALLQEGQQGKSLSLGDRCLQFVSLLSCPAGYIAGTVLCKLWDVYM